VHARPAPLFVQLDREGLFAGTGFHELDGARLERFRAAVADDAAGPALESAIEAAHAGGVETYGEALKTAPRGYPRDHPRVALLRHKGLFGGRRLECRADGIGRETALGHARSVWAACAPMNAWLERHAGPRAAEPAARAGRAGARSRGSRTARG